MFEKRRKDKRRTTSRPFGRPCLKKIPIRIKLGVAGLPGLGKRTTLENKIKYKKTLKKSLGKMSNKQKAEPPSKIIVNIKYKCLT